MALSQMSRSSLEICSRAISTIPPRLKRRFLSRTNVRTSGTLPNTRDEGHASSLHCSPMLDHDDFFSCFARCALILTSLISLCLMYWHCAKLMSSTFERCERTTMNAIQDAAMAQHTNGILAIRLYSVECSHFLILGA